ncbi:MAG TPA: sialidase family protein [Acidimicrobiales bacterium]|nr:sialidase family protein [Acidimicrobiales bacterium]
MTVEGVAPNVGAARAEEPDGQHPEDDSAEPEAWQRRRRTTNQWVALAGAVATILASAGMLSGVLLGPGPLRAEVQPDGAITAMDQQVAPANNSPLLAVDPTDSRFVVLANRLDAPDFGCALQVSGDGGRRWVTANPVPKLPAGAEKCYAPEVAFDAQGVVYYLFVGLQGAGNEPMGAFITTSRDRGATFSPPRQVLGPQNFSVRMAIDPSVGKQGRIHLLWLHATVDPPLGGFGPPPNPILTQYSDDGGQTFSAPVRVSARPDAHVVAPTMVLEPGGTVHVAYYDLGDDARDYQGLEGPVWDGKWSVVVRSSHDGGVHFGPEVVAEDGIIPFERVMLIFTMPPPALAVDGSRLCVAWTDARYGDPDALARCSGDGGRRWAPLARLNDDRQGNGTWQYLPRLSFSPGGRLDAVFYDRRDDPDNIGTDALATFSTDGGRTFRPNVKLSRENFDSRIGQEYAVPSAAGKVEFGSRLALVSADDHALAAWADTRNSRPVTTGQDLFGTRLELRRDRPGWARPVGAAALLVGLVVALFVWRRPTPVREP